MRELRGIFSYLYRKYVIALVQNSNNFFPSFLPFTVLCNPDIQVSTSILVYSVVIDAKECVVGGEEAVLWDVALGRMKRYGPPIGVDTWRGQVPTDQWVLIR